MSISFAQGYGIAEYPSIPATPETLYAVGSCTKSFTAAALALLIDDSANTTNPLGWTTPISSLVRDDFVLPDDYATIHTTLEDALSHRTGMPRHDISNAGTNQSVEAVVRLLRYLPMTAPLRQKFQYSNILYVTISHVIETLTSTPLGKVLHARIFEPLRMSSTFFGFSAAMRAIKSDPRMHLARGYNYVPSRKSYDPVAYDESPNNSGDGAIISSVLDFALYLRMYLDKSPPLSASAHLSLRTPRSFLDPVERFPNLGPISYGLGWMISSYRGQTLIGHNGAVPGFGALMFYMPWRQWGVAMMGNTFESTNYAQQILLYALLDELLETPQIERIDWKQEIEKTIDQKETDLRSYRERLYPNVPDPPLKRTLYLEAYTGIYQDKGYGAINVTLNLDPSKGPTHERMSTGKLYGQLMDRSDLIPKVHFEHVSGEFFIAVVTGDTHPLAAWKLEYRLNETGNVAALGIALESAMGEGKIWFEKVA